MPRKKTERPLIADIHPRCKNCLYYHPYKTDEGTGICYAMPPQIFRDSDDGEPDSTRPVVEASDYVCAFFRPRN